MFYLLNVLMGERIFYLCVGNVNFINFIYFFSALSSRLLAIVVTVPSMCVVLIYFWGTLIKTFCPI